jgi:predicted acyl esterase
MDKRALGFLVAVCAFAAHAEEKKLTGVFYDSPTEGLRYETATGSGWTDAEGGFKYRAGETVTFSVGKLVLGSVAVDPRLQRVTPAHLVAEVAGDVAKIKNQKVTNLARFVQSLDADGNVENGIVITRQTSATVSRYKGRIQFDQSEDAFTVDSNVAALFKELNKTLRTGPQARNHLRRTLLGIQKLSDVPIPTRDGLNLLGDIFRPIDDGEYPVVLTATKYGKAFGSGCACTPGAALDKETAEDAWFESQPGPTRPPYEVLVTPNSVDWVPQGYVIIRIDGRGSCNTDGLLHPYSAKEAEDNYDAIEWAARQPWSNGRIGMWGVSFTAASQLPVASLNPPHLTAIIPDSSDIDQYRDIVFQGGIYYKDYREGWFKNLVAARSLRCHDQPFVDIISLFHENRFDDPRVYGPYSHDPVTGETLPIGPVSPDPAKLTVPMWPHMRQDLWPIHIRGGSQVYREAASKDKKLTVQAGDEIVRSWDKDTVALHQQFFDYWLKGEDNGIMDEPPVRLEVRQPGGGWKTSFESEWPLARTRYVRYYLDAVNPQGNGALSQTPPAADRATTYSADVYTGPNGSRLQCTQYGVSFFSEPMTEDVELAGYMKLGLRVSSSSADMDIFATLRVLDENGQEVFYNTPPSAPSPITLGFLKVSHRKLDEKLSTSFQPVPTHTKADSQPLAANEKVQVEVELWNNTALVKKGHRIWLTVQPHDGCFVSAHNLHEYDASYHTGASNTIYTGGFEPSYLQIPVIPPKN